MLLIFYAHIYSRITYCLTIWGNASSKYLNIIHYQMNKCIRIITLKPYRSPTAELYSTDFLSFHQLKIYEIIFTIFKMKKGLMKTNFNFQTNFSTTNVNTRQKHQIRIPEFHTHASQRSLFYSGIVLFNRLPDDFKNILNIHKFKINLRHYVFNNFPLK